jgi:hypothetical protein
MSSDAVLASRWTDGAKGYVLGSYKWNSFRSAWEDRLRAAVAALDGMLPAPQSEPAETSAQDSAQEVLVEANKGSR